MSNKATSLAWEKYPYIPEQGSCVGKGAGYDPYIMAEATRFNDDLTVKLLKSLCPSSLSKNACISGSRTRAGASIL